MRLFVCLGLIITVSCVQSDHQKARNEKLLEEAARIHQSIVVTEGRVDSLLGVFEKRVNETQEATFWEDTLSQLHQDLEKWEENVVEVPGQESDTHHHHHHHHGNSIELSAEDMLAIQKTLYTDLAAIEHRLTLHLKKINNHVENQSL